MQVRILPGSLSFFSLVHSLLFLSIKMFTIDSFVYSYLYVLHRPCGLMAKASDFGSEDCRFKSCQGRVSFFFFFFSSLYIHMKLIPLCIDSFSDRPSSITTATTRQSKTKFPHFFARSSTQHKPQLLEHSFLPSKINHTPLKRTKSVTKLERQRRHQQPLTTAHHQSSDL